MLRAELRAAPPPSSKEVRHGARVTFINFEGDTRGSGAVRSSSAGPEHNRPVVGQQFLMSALGGKLPLGAMVADKLNDQINQPQSA